jgi:IS5 family transposase
LETFLPRAQQVIDQTIRRVFGGEKVPVQDKLFSIFEPHTDLIKRGKANHDTEFGHKVWFSELDGGIIGSVKYCQ